MVHGAHAENPLTPATRGKEPRHSSTNSSESLTESLGGRRVTPAPLPTHGLIGLADNELQVWERVAGLPRLEIVSTVRI